MEKSNINIFQNFSVSRLFVFELQQNEKIV